jgi:predicted nucleotidyltransferase component of viral defense system
MIPVAFINAWREHAPWSTSDQVEQDLVLSRAIVALYENPAVARALAFRGGTVLHKIQIKQSARYSNDLDFVQVAAAPIGPVLDAIRETLAAFLPGKVKYKAGERMATLTFGFRSEGPPTVPLKLKIEINVREHFSVYPLITLPFSMRNPWFSGSTACLTYSLSELIGTKLRALYQRRKGRDLFDLWFALTMMDLDAAEAVGCFNRYMEHDGHDITQRLFIENLADKHANSEFRSDMSLLLAPGISYDVDDAFELIAERIIPRLRN